MRWWQILSLSWLSTGYPVVDGRLF